MEGADLRDLGIGILIWTKLEQRYPALQPWPCQQAHHRDPDNYTGQQNGPSNTTSRSPESLSSRQGANYMPVWRDWRAWVREDDG